MTDHESKSKIGATPGKLLLIAVLAVALVSVLLAQLTVSDEPPGPQEDAETNSRSLARRTEDRTREPLSSPGNDNSLKQDRQWLKIPLEEVLQHDPFALPEALRPAAEPSLADTTNEASDDIQVHQQESQQQREELQRRREQALIAIRAQGVQMIFLGKKEQAAIIGNRRVRIGDEFEGFRVTDIGSDGVTLSELD